MSPIALLVALVCALAFAFGDVDALEYQRGQSADVWRYLTASFVHYGGEHLLTNLAALLVLGTLAERLVSGAVLAATVLTAAVASTVVLHLTLPGYQSFAGISVVNYVLLGAVAAGHPGRWAGVAIGLALLHQAMTAFDATGFAPSEIRPVWQLHLLGLVTGALIPCVLMRAIGCRSRRGAVARGMAR